MLERMMVRYRQSWFGRPNDLTNGRLLMVFVAVIGSWAAVGWLWKEDDAQQRQAAEARAEGREEARVVSEFTACLRSVEAGGEIQAVALAGVEQAEGTVELMRSIVSILESAHPESFLVDQIGLEVDEFQDGVVEYRLTAEAYKPRQLEDCPAPVLED